MVMFYLAYVKCTELVVGDVFTVFCSLIESTKTFRCTDHFDASCMNYLKRVIIVRCTSL